MYLIFSASYSYAGLSLRYSLRLGSSHSPGQQMRRKLMAILRLQCHAIFLDLKVRGKHFRVLLFLTFTVNTFYSKRKVSLMHLSFAHDEN